MKNIETKHSLTILDQIDLSTIKQAINRAETGLQKYLGLKEQFNSGIDVNNTDFQRAFNAFYKVSRRSSSWYQAFYEVFGKAIINDYTFDRILDDIFKLTGRVEASFASKMRSSIDESAVVIDSVVLKNLGFRLSRSSDPELRLRSAKQTYKLLTASIEAIRISNIGIVIINEFRKRYPLSNVTEVKAIDLTLWQLR